MNKKHFTILMVCFVAVLLISGCSWFKSPDKSQPDSFKTAAVNMPKPPEVRKVITTSSIQTKAVSIANFVFSPAEIIINVGDTVKWVNDDSVSHQVVGTDFDSGVLAQGKAFSQKFKTKGTFDYYCKIHPTMKGQIIVE